MSAPPQTPARPSFAWLLAPFLLVLLAAGLFAWQLVSLLSLVDDIQGVRPPAQVQVTDNGFTLFAGSEGLSPRCTLTGTDGTTHRLEDLGGSAHVSHDSQSWSALQNTPEGLVPGSFRLQCQGVPAGSELGLGPRVDVGGILGTVALGLVLPLLLGFLAFVLLIIFVVMRLVNSNRRRREQQGPGGPYVGPPPGPPCPGP